MDYTEVAQIDSPFEADVIADAFDDEGIPYIINPHMETAFSGLFAEARGWGSLLVPAGDHSRALALLEEVRKNIAESEPLPS